MYLKYQVLILQNGPFDWLLHYSNDTSIGGNLQFIEATLYTVEFGSLDQLFPI